MKTWTFEDACNRFSEVVRRAMADEPQLITRRGRAAAVVIGVDEYRRLTAPRAFLESLRDSPFAEALAEGELDLERPREYDRDVNCW